MAQATLKRPTAPAITQTKLLIDNQWVDPVDGGTFETYQPRHRRGASPRWPPPAAKDVDRAVKAARTALETGPWSTMDAADRGRLHVQARRPHRAERRGAGRARIAQLRQDHHRLAAATWQGVVNTLRYYAGWADKIEGRTVPVRGNFLVVHAAPAGRRRRPDHPVELPAADAGLEVGPGPGLRQHHRHEAGRADAADRPARSASWPSRPASPPASSTSSTASARRPAHAMVRPSRHRQDRLHRPRRYGQDHPEGRRRHAQAHDLRAGRQEPQRHLRRLPTWTQAVAGAFHAIYFHGGQCCTAGSRLFVEEKIHQEFVERLAEKAKERKLGDPLDPTTEQGPQVSQEQMDKILGYVDLGQKQGATLLTGGKRFGEQGLLRRADHLRQRQGRHGDRQGRDLRPGRQRAAVQGRRRGDRAGQQHQLRPGRRRLDEGHRQGPPASPSEVKAGTVWVNCYHVVDTTTPFGGFKMSGQGRENGEAALEHYTETKTVTVKLG